MSQLDGIKSAIYVIEEVDGDMDKTFSEFVDYKKAQKSQETESRACPKENHPSPVLYVGSSTTGVKNRINQHLGDCPNKTYALRLKNWFKGKYKITVLVYDEPIEVLQIIEDALAFELKPAFGKKGGNNK